MAEKVAGKQEEQSHQGNKKSNKNQHQQQQQQQQQQKKKKKYETTAWLVSPKAADAMFKKKKKKLNNNNTSTNSTSYNNSNNQNKISSNQNVNNNKKNKKKGSNKNQRSKNPDGHVNKPGGGICRSILKLSFITAASAIMLLSFLYIVDVKKYRSVIQEGEKTYYGVRQYLPLEVVTQGEKVYLQYVRPTIEVAVDKVLVLVNHTSTVLNTNPALKDHWSNINEISAIIGKRLAEYMRTVYKHIPIYYEYAKNKLF